MAFHRTMQLGVLGAVMALAAVPTTASATATMYSSYATWQPVANSPHEVQTLCTLPYTSACGTPVTTPPGVVYADSPDIQTGSPTPNTAVPLAWLRTATPTTPQVFLNHATGVSMYRNIVGTDTSPYGDPWSSFWPNDPKTGSAYTGDVWATKEATAAGAAYSNITLTLNSPLTTFGFIALPEDDTQSYNLTVTLMDGASVDTSLTETVGGCPISGKGAGCGFFGYTGGNNVTAINLQFALVPGDCDPSQGSTGKGSAPFLGSCNLQGGLALGDFFAGPAVPEPASLAILGAGLFGLGAIRRRRQRA